MDVKYWALCVVLGLLSWDSRISLAVLSISICALTIAWFWKTLMDNKWLLFVIIGFTVIGSALNIFTMENIIVNIVLASVPALAVTIVQYKPKKQQIREGTL